MPLICLFQILRGDRGIQLPGDIHRLFALMLHIVGSSEVGISLGTVCDPVGLELADK